MAKKIATEQYAYNIGVGKGSPTSNLMVTYSRAIALGCQIRYNTYSSSQLVRQEDLWTCSCQGATGSYNDCGSNCTCNSCNSDNIPQLKSFDWKSDGSHSYGLIAQELEEQGYSELVSDEGGQKTVKYSAALSLIVGKLQVKIKELEKEIENLKNKN